MIGRHALAGAIGLVLAGAFAFAGIALHPSRHRVRAEHVVGAGAYFHGGVPTYDPAIERVIGDQLADLVIAVDQGHFGRIDDAPLVARGAELAGAWNDLLAGLQRWSSRDGGAGELRKRAHAVSDAFTTLGLGYYLRADVISDHGVKHAAVFAFRVERVSFVRIANEPHRVLELRRLDRLNLRYALLGAQSDDLGDPVVMLDEVDEWIASHVDPVLRGDGWPLDDPALSAAAGDAVRRELAGRDATEIHRLVIASVSRHEARHDYDAEREAPRDRARAELSAYLSQIANDPVTPQLALWNLATLARRRGSAESEVAKIVLAGLAHGEPVRALAQLSDDDLRARARALWRDLYGEPCAVVVDAW